MKAGVASETGLAIAQIAKPQPGPEQVLVRVAAAGMNRADLNAAKGAGVASKDAFGRAIGMEWAGEIVGVGKSVTSFKAGDLVMCSGTGGYAEYAVADAGRTLPLHNSGLSLDQAAVLPLALMTAHDAVVTNGKLSTGDVVLVHGAASAVGLAALQIAKALGASQIIGTSSSKTRGPRLVEFGADRVIDSSDPAWADQVLEATGGAGANVIIDMVSGPSINASMKAAAVKGRVVNVGRLGGVKAEFDFDLHALKRLNYIGTTFRTRSVEEVREIVRLMRHDLWDAIVLGDIRLPIDTRFALDDAFAAHDHMRTNQHFGKIVITP